MKMIKSVLLSTASVGVALGLALAPANAQTSGDQPPPPANQLEGGAMGDAEIQGQGGGTGLDAQGGVGTMTQGDLKPQGDLKAQGDMKAQGDLKTQDQGSAGSAGASGELNAKSGTKMDDSAGATGENTAGAEGEAGADTKTTAGADTKAGASSEAKIELNQEQKTEIKQVFTENTTVIQSAPRVERTAVSVSVGVAIPTHVRLAPLPSTIVVDVPSDCELMYFVWGSDVVIVDDCSRRVVEIIVNVA
jgi:hypothetical protein